jgi:indole-3-glycerol phosphate synthase
MMEKIFAQILDRKQRAVAQLRASSSLEDFRERALEIRKKARRHRLLRALESDAPELNIIAEFKRRSPSLGIIRDDLSADEVARCYERGGACAISVLTDEEFFGGSIVDLRVARSSTNLPLLRKDFIIDPIQIYEAAITGADAVLLIVAALDNTSLKDLRSLAEDELGLDALVEVHSSEELNCALNADAKIIGVNNRDLRTFRSSLDTSERLIAEAPRDRILISESGLQSVKDLRHLQALGFRAFLIGEALMRAPNPEMALRDLLVQPEDQASLQRGCSHRPVAGSTASSTAHSDVATAQSHDGHTN